MNNKGVSRRVLRTAAPKPSEIEAQRGEGGLPLVHTRPRRA
jgi:hypothetical protein